MEVDGVVIGVGFEPGRHFVRLKAVDASGAEVTFQATRDQVEQALAHRDTRVRVLAIVGQAFKKLFRIKPVRSRESD